MNETARTRRRLSVRLKLEEGAGCPAVAGGSLVDTLESLLLGLHGFTTLQFVLPRKWVCGSLEGTMMIKQWVFLLYYMSAWMSCSEPENWWKSLRWPKMAISTRSCSHFRLLQNHVQIMFKPCLAHCKNPWTVQPSIFPCFSDGLRGFRVAFFGRWKW